MGACQAADRSQPPPPLSSRIIRAANGYDDLAGTSTDPSQAAEAVGRLRLDTASEYDPAVVEALSPLGTTSGASSAADLGRLAEDGDEGGHGLAGVGAGC